MHQDERIAGQAAIQPLAARTLIFSNKQVSFTPLFFTLGETFSLQMERTEAINGRTAVRR